MILMSVQLSTAVISYQQLFFTSRSTKIYVRDLLAKSLFSKKFWKLSGDEFWVLKLFCSSKTDQVTIFFFFNGPNIRAGYCLLGSIMCPSWVTLGSFNTYLRSFQLIFSCWIVDFGRSCRSLILFWATEKFTCSKCTSNKYPLHFGQKSFSYRACDIDFRWSQHE